MGTLIDIEDLKKIHNYYPQNIEKTFPDLGLQDYETHMNQIADFGGLLNIPFFYPILNKTDSFLETAKGLYRKLQGPFE